MRLFIHNKRYDPFSLIKIEDKIVELKTHYDVLDHGFVKYINHMGGEESIIEAARQSTQKGFLGWGDSITHQGPCRDKFGVQLINPPLNIHDIQRCVVESDKGDEKLLEYLYKNKHFTPFEMCELIVQIKAPIFIFREIHRHRTFSYNEMSARYIQMPNEHYVPDVRLQDKKNKQSSGKSFNGTPNEIFRDEIEQDQNEIYASYERYIAQGIAKEVARINTPVSRYSIMWMKGNLRNWLQFLQLRDHKAAQLEMQLYGQAIGGIIESLYPRVYTLYLEYTKNAINLSAEDVQALKTLLNDHKDVFEGTTVEKLLERL